MFGIARESSFRDDAMLGFYISLVRIDRSGQMPMAFALAVKSLADSEKQL